MIYIYNKDISNRILKGADFMEIAKIFESGRSQAVRIPKKSFFGRGSCYSEDRLFADTYPKDTVMGQFFIWC